MRENLTWLPLGGSEDRENAIAIAEIYQCYAQEMDLGKTRPLSKIEFSRKMSRSIPDYKSRAIKVSRSSVDVRVIMGVRVNARISH